VKEAGFAADTALAEVCEGRRIAVGIAAGFPEVGRAEVGAVYSNGLIVSRDYSISALVAFGSGAGWDGAAREDFGGWFSI
jgi:hypothetical protein